MDVHRCRFVPYQPSAINALAFSHTRARSSKQQSLARLAIGRSNGDIEIWNPSTASWHQEVIIRGGKDRSVDGLVWINEPDTDIGNGNFVIGKSRLFSIGYTSTVTEWDLAKGKPRKHASGQHGDIWCMAAQPAAIIEKNRPNGVVHEVQASNKLLCGTIDGELVMYTVEDGDLRLQRILVKSPTKKAQMVSITFQSRKVAIVGCSDSTIRAYDISTGQVLRRMTLGADLAGGSKDTIVWSVKCLPNGNIVSGDSTGQVCIWDGKTYTQTQRIQSHKQDVLSLTTSADGSAILSGGMDRRTVLYKQSQGHDGRWSKITGRRYHEHDVKSLASFEHGTVSVVVSGGPDSNLVVLPLKELGRENHRLISSLPQEPAITSAPKSRFVVSWWDREIHIWLLKRTPSSILDAGDEDDVDINQNRKLLKTIVVKGDANISSATINADGTLLFVSTALAIKGFRLQHQSPEKPGDVAVSSFEVSEWLASLGATKVELSPDEQWLCIVREGFKVLMAKVSMDDQSTTQAHSLRRIRRVIAKHIQSGGLGSYDRTITHVAFSADSRMMVSVDLAGYIDTWVLRSGLTNGHMAENDDTSAESSSSEDEETSQDGPRWIPNPQGKLLPKLPSATAVLSFSDQVPDSQHVDNSEAVDYCLLVITTSWQILTFHPWQGSLTPWARRHPKAALPTAIQGLLDLAKGAIWEGQRVWIYGISFFFMLDMSKDLPKPTPSADVVAENSTKKRKRIGPTTGAGGQMKKGNIAPHAIRKHTSAVPDGFTDMDLDGSPPSDSDSEEDVDRAPAGELSHLRTTGLADDALTNGKNSAVVNSGESKPWWITYKYRPIFGIVPLNQAGEALEVAVVERPTWDVDLPDRYFGKGEWERR